MAEQAIPYSIQPWKTFTTASASTGAVAFLYSSNKKLVVTDDRSAKAEAFLNYLD